MLINKLISCSMESSIISFRIFSFFFNVYIPFLSGFSLLSDISRKDNTSKQHIVYHVCLISCLMWE